MTEALRFNAPRPKKSKNGTVDNNVGSQAAYLLSKWLTFWPAHSTSKAEIDRMLFVLSSACQRAQEAVPPEAGRQRQKPIYDLLDRLGPVYQRVSSRRPACWKWEKSRQKGEFVSFVEEIVNKLLPPEVKREATGRVTVGSIGDAVKNWLAVAHVNAAEKRFLSQLV